MPVPTLSLAVGVGMVGSGLWAVGVVGWLWAGGLSGESIRPEENRGPARPPARWASTSTHVAATAGEAVTFVSAPASQPRTRDNSPQGDPSWRKGRPASPGELQVLPSMSSALTGEQVSVKVSAREDSVVRGEVFRLGVYGGTGAVKVWSGGPYTVSLLPRCAGAPCSERQTFSFEVARDWEPGLYLIKVTRSDGTRSFTSIVVKASPAPGPRS